MSDTPLWLSAENPSPFFRVTDGIWTLPPFSAAFSVTACVETTETEFIHLYFE